MYYNGNSILQDTSVRNGATFEINLNNVQSSPLELVITSPVNDTVHLSGVQLSPAYTYQDSICEGNVYQIIGDAQFDHNWINYGQMGGTLNLTPQDYTIGINSVNVISASNLYACEIDTVLSFYVNSTTVSFINPAISPVCSTAAPFSLPQAIPSNGTYSGTGVSNNIFDPAAAGIGIYTIEYEAIDSNNCDVLDSIVIEVFDCASLEELYSGNVRIYPTPFSDKVSIEINSFEDQDYTLELHDLYGRKIHSQSITNGIGIISNLESLASGDYFVELYSTLGEILHRQRIVKCN